MSDLRVGSGPQQVIAHRGGSLEGVQNSISTICGAASSGVDGIETDVRATSDGVAVLCHDSDLGAMSDCSVPVSQMTWDQVRRVELHDGSNPVRLEEALEACPLPFSVDAKEDAVARPLARAVAACGAQDRVTLATFSHRRMRLLRRLGQFRTSLTPVEVARLMAVAAACHDVANARSEALRRAIFGDAPGVVSAQVPMFAKGWLPVVTNRFVQVAHAAELAVQAWTINGQRDLEDLLGWPASDERVDGVITDEPTLALQILSK